MSSADEPWSAVDDGYQVTGREPLPPLGWSAVGVLALAGTKAGDVLSTLAGLHLVGGLSEGNPLVATTMGSIGTVPGLLVVAAVTVLCIVAVTEAAVLLLRERYAVRSARVRYVRAVGYGLPALLNVAVTAHNVALIASV